jgi:DNA-binding MarR family transcriptional regulator
MNPRRDAPGGTSNTPDSLAVGRTLFGLFAAAVRRSPRELSLTALSTLATLDRSGPRRITDLAAVEGVTQPSMTALVRTLELSAFVERLTDPADKRVVLVAITGSGARYRRVRRQAGAETFALLIEKLPPQERQALAAASTALEHLLELDEEDRNGATVAVEERSDGGVL